MGRLLSGGILTPVSGLNVEVGKSEEEEVESWPGGSEYSEGRGIGSAGAGEGRGLQGDTCGLY